jgi:hypothetical protein
VTEQLGSPGCPVQVHIPALHWSRIDDLQALRAAPDKPGHPAAISSEHAFAPQIGDAALAPETKTPAPSATAANVTTALRVIVEPPLVARSRARHRFRRTTAASDVRLRLLPLVKGFGQILRKGAGSGPVRGEGHSVAEGGEALGVIAREAVRLEALELIGTITALFAEGDGKVLSDVSPRSEGTVHDAADRFTSTQECLLHLMVERDGQRTPQDPESPGLPLWSRVSRENTRVSSAGATLQRLVRLRSGHDKARRAANAGWVILCPPGPAGPRGLCYAPGSGSSRLVVGLEASPSRRRAPCRDAGTCEPSSPDGFARRLAPDESSRRGPGPVARRGKLRIEGSVRGCSVTQEAHRSLTRPSPHRPPSSRPSRERRRRCSDCAAQPR